MHTKENYSLYIVRSLDENSWKSYVGFEALCSQISANISHSIVFRKFLLSLQKTVLYIWYLNAGGLRHQTLPIDI